MFKKSILIPLVLIVIIITGAFLFSGGTQLDICHVRVFHASCGSLNYDLAALLSSIILTILASIILEDDREKHLGQAKISAAASLNKFYNPLAESLRRGILQPKLCGHCRR